VCQLVCGPATVHQCRRSVYTVLMSSMQDIDSQFTNTMNNVMQRLRDMESEILSEDYPTLSSVQSASPET